MADTTHKLIGQNYTPPDLVAKVTGQAKYAEDFRAEGMLFTKLLLSPMPHARVRNIDASAALAMPGVHAILTEEDCPNPGSAILGEGVVISDEQNIRPEMILTNEPRYQGEPILAVAADSEELAADAIERIVVDLEPLPFVVDPIEALRPGSPNPRTEGNVWVGNHVEILKWTAEDWQEVAAGRLPLRETPEMWEVGDVDAAYEAADLKLDETVVFGSNSHEPLESRSAMAYWQNGKVYLHSSTQSIMMARPAMANLLGVSPADVVLICEYCGGGFGSKYMGTPPVGDPGVAVEEDEPPGDDADQPRRGALHRAWARRAAHACQDRLPPGWAHHRDGPRYRAGQRPVRETERPPLVRRVCGRDVRAGDHAVSGNLGADQHAATALAPRPGWGAGVDDARPAGQPGRQSAWH